MLLRRFVWSRKCQLEVEAGWQFGNDILDGAVAALFPSRTLTMGSKRKLQSRQCFMPFMEDFILSP